MQAMAASMITAKTGIPFNDRHNIFAFRFSILLIRRQKESNNMPERTEKLIPFGEPGFNVSDKWDLNEGYIYCISGPLGSLSGTCIHLVVRKCHQLHQGCPHTNDLIRLFPYSFSAPG